EPEAVKEIIARCARLPLALALVAARAVVRPHGGVRMVGAELRDTQQRGQTLTRGAPSSDANAELFWSLHSLTPGAARPLPVPRAAARPGPVGDGRGQPRRTPGQRGATGAG